MVGRSSAKGDFGAVLESSGSVEAGGSITVTNTWNGKADVEVTPSAGGVEAGSFEDNTADATVNTTATAAITGTGSVTANGDVKVQNQSQDVKAYAKINGAEFKIEGITVASNVSHAHMIATQATYISGVDVTSINGNVIVTGDLKPVSHAQTGASGGVSVSLIGAKITSVSADSATTNEAYIKNANVNAQKGKVLVEALTDSTTTGEALAPLFEASIESLGVIVVNTDSKDAVISYIDADDGVTSKVTAMRVDVLATSKDTVTAIGQLPLLKLSFDMANAVVLTGSAAKVTESSTEGKVTKAYIGKNTKVTALGSDESNDMHSVNVKADSEIVLKTELPVSISLDGRHLGVYFVTAQVGKTDTQAYIGGDVLSYMDINVEANDVIREDSDIEVYNVSGFAANFSYSTNKVGSQNVRAYVLDNANLLAWGDIKVLAHSDLDMEAGIKMGSASLFSAGKLEARNEITARNISAEVGDNVTMVSEQGNITVKAYAEDTITTNSTGVSASLADLIGGDPKAFIVYNGDIKTTVGNGTNVKAAYGTVDIVSDLNSDLYASAFRKAASIVSDNESIADILSKVKIHTEINPDGNTQSRILGRITTIGSYISDQLIHAYALSETAAAGSNTTATANINADNDLDIIIGNAWVGGTEILNVESIIVKQKLWAESYAEIVGATGKVFA